MVKIDFIKDNKVLYTPSSKEPSIVEIPEMLFLSVEGKGDPNTSESYKAAVESLYSVSYTIKFFPKKGVEIKGYKDYKVGPLEGLWWMKDNNEFITASKKDNWQWIMMIRQPEFITKEIVKLALAKAKEKKFNSTFSLVKYGPYIEGKAVQLMHIGPYSEEHPNIMRMHKYALDLGYKLHGKHHEIYLGDPRKTDPTKLKTVLRQPVLQS